MVNKCAKKIIKEIRGKFRTLERESKRNKHVKTVKLYNWIHQNRAIEMDQPVPSPNIYEYRNKCEFTVGYRLVSLKEDDEEEEEDDKQPMVMKNGGDGGSLKEEEEEEEEEMMTVEEGGKDEDMKKVGGTVVEGDWVMVDENVKTEDESATAVVGNAKVVASTASKDGDDDAITPQPPTSTFQKVPACGFLAQGWSGGVYPPHTLQNMPDWSCGLADIFNDFLPTSKMPPYDSKIHRGIWRTITLRCSLRTKECMVIVMHAPPKGGAGAKDDGSDDYTTVFEEEKNRLVKMLTKDVIPTPVRDFPEDHVVKDDGKRNADSSEEGIRVTSIYFQEYDGLSHPTVDHPVQVSLMILHTFGSIPFNFQPQTQTSFQIYSTSTERKILKRSLVTVHFKYHQVHSSKPTLRVPKFCTILYLIGLRR